MLLPLSDINYSRSSSFDCLAKHLLCRLAAALVAGLLALTSLAALGQTPVISSFSRNGELICTNLAPGRVAVVEWASSAAGPWTNNWTGLDYIVADSNGVIRVSVPMFYRVRGIPGSSDNTNAPAGMALIPAGLFTMGDAFSEGYGQEGPTHSVYVSAFYMDQTEVSKALWDEVYQWGISHGYSFDSGAQGKASNHPAHWITWYGAVQWCNARSEKEGRVPAYYTSAEQTMVYRTGGRVDVRNDMVKWDAGYRLPTEAEWEKAARGGASGQRFPWAPADTITHSRANYVSDPYYAYDVSSTRGYHPTYNDGVLPYTSPVGSFAANGYGLYDMAGNVWEWCWDWFGGRDYYSSSPGTDPRGPSSGSTRVFRGGSWNSGAFDSRSAARYGEYPYRTGDNNIGLRTVLPDPQP